MQSVSHALRITQALKKGIHDELARTRHEPVSKEDAAQSAELHEKSTALLKHSIASVDATLRKIRQVKASKGARAKGAKAAASNVEIVEKAAEKIIPVPTKPKPRPRPKPFPAKPKEPEPPTDPEGLKASAFPANVQNVLNTFGHLGSNGLGQVATTVDGMISSIEPAIDTFDHILVQPYLENHSATLDTVPVVGLKNEQVFYLATVKGAAASGGIKVEWRHFSELPDGFQLPTPVSNGNGVYYPGVHLFPYAGHLFISNGKAVWRREHLGAEDEALANAVDDYSKMYHNSWQKVGDNVLPASNLRNVVPYFEISPAGQQVIQRLVVLHDDSSISIIKETTLTSSATWNALAFDNTLEVNDQWEHIAYWNNKIVAITNEAGNTYSQNLRLDLPNLRYSISNKALIDPVIELTATEVGPVAIQNDGTMRIRRIDEDQVTGDEPTEDIPDDANVLEDLFIPEPVEWHTLALSDGVTNIGIASAGVLLNLNLLARALKSRYIDSQLALYPVMTRFRAFALVHKLHLQQIKAIAESFPYPDIPDDGAVQVSTRLVNHAKQWSNLLNTNISASSDAVVLMARQLDDVSEDIEIQLNKLKDDLVILQGILDENRDQLSTFRRAFIGTLITGILLLAAAGGSFYFGLIGGKAAIFLGLLGVGAITAAAVTGTKMANLRGEVERGQLAVDAVNGAINELTFISSRFIDLEGSYDSLKQFWGQLKLDAQTIDKIYLPLMGEDIFSMLLSPELYEEAISRTEAIENASQAYVDMLNRQGIILPTSAATRGMSRAAANREPTADDMIEEARVCLEKGDFAGYETKLEEAVVLDRAERTELEAAIVKTGVFFDVASLRSKASVWAFKASAATRPIEAEVAKAGRAVAMLLNKTIDVCEQTQDALEAWRKSDMKEINLETAMATCMEAQGFAAEANNAFVNANHVATNYQQGLERDIASLKSQIKVAKAVADERRKAVASSAPWYVYISPAALTAWVLKKKAEISKQLERDISRLNSAMGEFQKQILSGSTFLGDQLTWQQMVQEVSGRLGDIYAVLDVVQTFIVEVPEILQQKDIAAIQWDTIAQDAREVRAILAGQGVRSQALQLARRNRAQPPELNKHTLVNALKPAATLTENLTKQAAGAQNFFEVLDELATTPTLAGIFGSYYEEDDGDDELDEVTEGPVRQSLQEIAVELRLRFADAGAKQFPTVNTIEAMALLQKLRVQYLATGAESLNRVMANSQYFNDVALDKALGSYDYYLENVKAWFVGITTTMRATLEDLKEEIGELDENIEELEEQQRKNIISLVAKVVALAFTLSGAIVSLGALSPSVAAKVAAGKFAKVGFKVAKKTVKTALESSSIREVRLSILALKNARRELDLQAQRIEDLLPKVGGVEIELGGFNGLLEGMGIATSNIRNNLEQFEGIVLTQEDVGEIHAAWDGVIEGANKLAGVFDAAGITS